VTPSPVPPKPLLNDTLFQALSPVQKMIGDQARLDLIRKKYGVQPLSKPLPPQPQQWVGDNNA
jgi:hypothetical protein